MVSSVGHLQLSVEILWEILNSIFCGKLILNSIFNTYRLTVDLL